jgi:hypothetical protein
MVLHLLPRSSGNDIAPGCLPHRLGRGQGVPIGAGRVPRPGRWAGEGAGSFRFRSHVSTPLQRACGGPPPSCLPRPRLSALEPPARPASGIRHVQRGLVAGMRVMMAGPARLAKGAGASDVAIALPPGRTMGANSAAPLQRGHYRAGCGCTVLQPVDEPGTDVRRKDIEMSVIEAPSIRYRSSTRPISTNPTFR